MSLFQEVIKIIAMGATPTVILIIGGRWLLNIYEVKKKGAEERITLTRFIRERQYDSLHELQDVFSFFMKLYREMSSPRTDMSVESTRRDFEERCIQAETEIDGIILRITSEFGHTTDKLLVEKLAILRQSVQTWRETVRTGKRVRFGSSSHPDYMLFKQSFSNVMTFLLKELHAHLNPPEIRSETSAKLFNEVFDNKWEDKYEERRKAFF